uniref:Ras protein specific guanine nucleotide releasing factor 1 n=1 Tax=Serinus canaria TaxID=9135 RepID=A0A8C9NJN5_SERCA
MEKRKDGARRGYLSKRSADNTKWHTKWFALLQNMLFYFETDSSSRPSGLYLLEGCVCDRAPSPKPPLSAKDSLEKQHYFTVNFNHENQKTLELRTEDAKDCDEWVAAIAHASYRNLATEHEALMQKYLHLLQIVETEKTVAKQLRQQIEDGEIEIERLKAEVKGPAAPSDDDSDIKKIKKVQSFLRGWLCRRKWKTIIQDYIRSPHADSMRKRNQVVFSMLEAEAEYVQQLHILVNNFLRPLRMAASSKKPPITHDDVSSIFLNSETIMFLHQIFYQGLKARISSWPTLVLADLFDILLPMLNIYQEFVRNHQYSLQILAHCKQNRDFDKLLKHYEAKPDCEERTLETFLTYPMFQIPRYILTLHELLAHTPHEHVERNSLDYAKSKLEELSRIMHDEVSETENIRKNLAIERMIIEGCEILLDTSQTFVRQGLCQCQRPPLCAEREPRGPVPVLCAPVASGWERGDGKWFPNHCVGFFCSKAKTSGQDIDHLDFKIVVEPKDSSSFTVILVASSRQEKAAWTSDISQCVDNIRCNGLMMNAFEENSKVTVPQMIKSLELLFANSQNNKLLYGEPPKSPRANRKFSSPPPLSISKSSSPSRRRKLSLNIPIITGGKALDLAALSCSSNGYAGVYSSMAPFSKTTLDINKLYVSSSYPNKIPDEGEAASEKQEESQPGKQRRGCSVRAEGPLAVSGFPTDQRNGDKEFVIRRAATNRVLNVLRHWVSKHSQDFETNEELKFRVIGFLEEVIHDPELLTQERKAAANIIRTLTQEDPGDNQITLEEVVQMAEGVRAEPFENHSALEIAEQLTLLDHLVFKKIPYEEFFGQGWMKLEKNERTPYIMKNTKHFNDVSNLIASEIIRNEEITARASAIEKWVAVADICRCLHNYNAVLEITSSLNRSAIFRLKKTWLKVSKQTKALIDKLQKLVSSEGRFKNLREALKNCDPPCVPYLGMYLTDLAFIEEGTPNYTEDGLVNFSKMRMISHIIREIRQFQQTSYKIEHQPKVTQYLLDQSGVMDEESLYEASLRIEPKLPS